MMLVPILEIDFLEDPEDHWFIEDIGMKYGKTYFLDIGGERIGEVMYWEQSGSRHIECIVNKHPNVSLLGIDDQECKVSLVAQGLEIHKRCHVSIRSLGKVEGAIRYKVHLNLLDEDSVF